MGRNSAKAAVADGAIDPLLRPIRQAFAKNAEGTVGRVLSAKGWRSRGWRATRWRARHST